MGFEKLYTAEDAAQITGLTLRTIRNYIRDGKLKGRRIGVQWRFTQEDIEALFDVPGKDSEGVPDVRPQRVEEPQKAAAGQPFQEMPRRTAQAETAAVQEKKTQVEMTREKSPEPASPAAALVENFLRRRKAPRFCACAAIDIPGVTEQEARYLYERLKSLAKVYQDGPKRLEMSYEYDEFREQARFAFSGAMEAACAMMNLCEAQ